MSGLVSRGLWGLTLDDRVVICQEEDPVPITLCMQGGQIQHRGYRGTGEGQSETCCNAGHVTQCQAALMNARLYLLRGEIQML